MKKFKNYTLKEYLDQLAKKEPVPGGGSVAALTGALATSLVSMVANYSLKNQSADAQKKIKNILSVSKKLRRRLLELVDLDAEAYLGWVKAKKGTPKQKLIAAKKARAVPTEIARLCYQSIEQVPYLVKHGNKYLMSDLEVAVEILTASFLSAIAIANSNS